MSGTATENEEYRIHITPAIGVRIVFSFLTEKSHTTVVDTEAIARNIANSRDTKYGKIVPKDGAIEER